MTATTWSRRLPPALVAVALVLAARPFLQPRLVAGHDSRAYPARIVEYFENLRHGVLVPRWAPDLGGGHGVPLFILNPPLFVAVASAFHALGPSVIASQNLAIVGFQLALALAMYAAGKRLAGGDPGAGALAAIALLYAPYLQLDLYVRGAASEAAALAALPVLLLGVERLTSGHTAAGVALVATAVAWTGVAHNVVFLVATVLGAFLVAAAAAAARDLRIAARGAAAIALGALAASFVIVPSLVEGRDMAVAKLAAAYGDYHHHFLYWTQLGSLKWAYGYSVPGKDDGMGFGIGPAHALLGGLGLLAALRAPERRDRFLALVLALATALAVFLTLGISRPIWQALPFLHPMSFPWRFLMVPAFCLSALAALAVRGRPRVALAAALAVVALDLVHTKPQALLPDRDTDYAPKRLAERLWEAGWFFEFQPRWVETQPGYTVEPAELDGSARETLSTPIAHRYTLDVAAGAAGAPAQPVRLRLYYFPGWHVWIDGVPAAIRPELEFGRIELDCPPGRHQVEARFEHTPVRTLSELLSLGAVLVLIGWAMVGWRR